MYSEILKAIASQILNEYGVKFFLTFENNSRIKRFKNFEKIYMYSENLRKFMKNFETEYSVEITMFIIRINMET